MNATIFNIERFAIHDGPGIRTTVFFKGCPLRCPWCANPESQKAARQLQHQSNKCSTCQSCVRNCPNGAILCKEGRIVINREACKKCKVCVEVCPNGALSIVGQEQSIEKIYEVLIRDKDYYEASGGGITLSGGEVMLQWKVAKELLRKAKAEGIHTAVETCGDVPIEAFEELTGYVDLFLFDIKHMDAEKLRNVTGGSLERILQNVSYLAKQKEHQMIIRVPVIPEFNDNAAVMTQIFELAQRFGIPEVHLLPYHTLGIHKYEQLGMTYQMKEQGMTKEELQSFVRMGEQMGLSVGIGG